MKKRIKHGLIRVLETLLLVLAAATVLFFIVRSWRNSRPVEEGTDAGTVVTEDLSVVNSVSCDNGSEVLTFTLGEDGKWVWIDEAFPLNQEAVGEFVDALTSFVPTVTVASGETVDLGSYELDSPLYEVSYTTRGGETTALQFGKTAENGGAYVKYAGDESSVYLSGSALLKQVKQGLYDYCTLPSFPALNNDTLKSITFSSRKNSATYTVREQKGENHWYLGSNDVTQSIPLISAREEIAALSFSALLVWDPLADSLAICGLTDPFAKLEFTYVDAAGRDVTLTLSIGNERDENSYFATWSASNAVFTIEKSRVERIMALIDSI